MATMGAPGSPRTIKLVIIGDSGAGKTSFRNQYITGQFTSAYRATIGADFITKRMPHYSRPDEAVILQIWDTAGQERFSALSTAFFRGADAAIFMFDAARPDSVAGLRHWWDQFVAKCPVLEGTETEFCAVFVGNKVELLRERSRHANESLDAENYVGCSGKASGGDLHITEKLVQSFLRDLIPTKSEHAPTSASSRRRTIHIDSPFGISSSQTGEDRASRSAEISRGSLAHAHSYSGSSDSEFEPELPPRSPSRSRSLGMPSGSSCARWIQNKPHGLGREGNGTATTARTTYHTPATSLFRGDSPARGEPNHGASFPYSQHHRGDLSIMTMETAHSHFSTSTPVQPTPLRTASCASTVTNVSGDTVKPHEQAQTPSDGVSTKCPELPTSEATSLEMGPKFFWSSAYTGEGVALVFEYIVRRVVRRWEWEESRLGFDEGVEGEARPTALGLRDDWRAGERGWRSACC